VRSVARIALWRDDARPARVPEIVTLPFADFSVLRVNFDGVALISSGEATPASPPVAVAKSCARADARRRQHASVLAHA
jgi:hypothetical protein